MMTMRCTSIAILLSFVTACAFAQNTDLGHGEIELRGFGGVVAAGNFQFNPAFAGGVEGALGLNRFFALTGHYAFDSLGSSGISYPGYSFHEHRSVHEFMGGFRVSFPNRTRLTPYAAFDAGGANYRDTTSGTFNFSGSSNHFAAAVGAGANYRMTRRTGINIDVTGTALSCGLTCTPLIIVRPSAGLYLRFGKSE